MALKLKPETIRAAVAAVAAMSVSACGVDGVELNGKIFDAVGLNTGSVKSEPKLKDRAPLVVPPGLEAGLPEPGSGKAATAAYDPGIADHDAINKPGKAELERRQAEYCKVHYEQAKAHGDETADLAKGPLGECRPSVLTAIGKANEEEPEE